VRGVAHKRVSGLRFRVSGFGFRVSGFGFRDSGFEFWISSFGVRISAFRFRVQELRFRVWGELLHRNVLRFRGGLVFKAHKLCVSLNSRLASNKEAEELWGVGVGFRVWQRT